MPPLPMPMPLTVPRIAAPLAASFTSGSPESRSARFSGESPVRSARPRFAAFLRSRQPGFCRSPSAIEASCPQERLASHGGTVTRLPDPPRSAAWQHREARDGFEVVFLSTTDAGDLRVDGTTAAVEEGQAWAVQYSIRLAGWVTRTAKVTGSSAQGTRERTLDADGAGHWRLDGEPAPLLDGCRDGDLESSSLTNAFPVNRLRLQIGGAADAPAAYVRATDLSVERLEQRYVRLPDVEGRERYHYSAPRFAFECELVYDESGLLLDYPGIAVRHS
jgi:hypothetical protein